jgi:hypothetical protein
VEQGARHREVGLVWTIQLSTESGRGSNSMVHLLDDMVVAEQ